MIERYLVALSVVGLVDAVSYMVVAPSIIFYVLQQGGTKEDYGIILSAFSFASFCAKPFLGAWSDRIGFRVPYLCSLVLSAFGGFLYLIASLYSTRTAILLILLGRLLGGVGAASSALGFAYLANVVPNDQQTKVNSLLSMLRIVGMAAGPGVNVFLDKVNVQVGPLVVDPLNAVGLVLMMSNVVALASIYFLLEEPQGQTSETKQEKDEKDSSQWTVVKAMFCAEIFVPIFCIFTFNANFQLIETGFAPAASHALGWGPIQTSTVLGSISIVIFAVMIIVYQLSSHKVRDESLLTFGLCLSAFGYTMIYILWVMGAPAWHFYVPMMFSASAFPFLGAPTRSLFSKAVETKPMLAVYSGTMQAILSMFASVAGFVTPGLVAAYVLRHPTEVEESSDHRELSPLALFAPALSTTTLFGLSYITWKQRRSPVLRDAGMADEQSFLLAGINEPPARRHSYPVKRRYSCHVEAHRRQSVTCMGIAQNSTLYEHDATEMEPLDLIT